MYPLNTQQSYPHHQWWIGAYADEIGHHIVGRSILGQRVIIYRTRAGEAVALSGICPHRAYPLEKGRLVDDAVQCGYHGFTFGKDGSCIRVPTQDAAPTRAAVRRFPVIERGGLIWIWTGPESAADPALMPDIGRLGLGAPGWKVEQHPRVTIQARYTLLIDNLLDLSHASFIHADTIPGGQALAAMPVEVIETQGSLTVQRLGRDLPGNPLLRLQFPRHEGHFDQHFDAEYLGPNLLRTGGTTYPAGGAQPLGTQNYLHGITPESPTSVHYFVMTARDFGLDNEALSQLNLDMGARIQPQDIDAIESVERVLQSLVEAPHEISARVDTGALKVRRRLQRQILAEEAGQAALSGAADPALNPGGPR